MQTCLTFHLHILSPLDTSHLGYHPYPFHLSISTERNTSSLSQSHLRVKQEYSGNSGVSDNVMGWKIYSLSNYTRPLGQLKKPARTKSKQRNRRDLMPKLHARKKRERRTRIEKRDQESGHDTSISMKKNWRDDVSPRWPSLRVHDVAVASSQKNQTRMRFPRRKRIKKGIGTPLASQVLRELKPLLEERVRRQHGPNSVRWRSINQHRRADRVASELQMGHRSNLSPQVPSRNEIAVKWT